MSKLNTATKAILVLFALILVAALSTTSFAQGRGKGNGVGPNVDKKCAKFVNCHDARDGRWDGRGPAVNRGISPIIIPIGSPTYPDIYRNRRHRDKQRDDEIGTSTRNRRTDRGQDRDNDTWRRRRTSSDGTEIRNRRVHRHNRTDID